ncbi:MAG TPA: hypothetical protein PLG84_04685 [Anaerolineaceae bacterium]|jgi:hypothetical protein|nr:hypothetical protein [Anaerolineaceae bacterium]
MTTIVIASAAKRTPCLRGFHVLAWSPDHARPVTARSPSATFVIASTATPKGARLDKGRLLQSLELLRNDKHRHRERSEANSLPARLGHPGPGRKGSEKQQISPALSEEV